MKIKTKLYHVNELNLQIAIRLICTFNSGCRFLEMLWLLFGKQYLLSATHFYMNLLDRTAYCSLSCAPTESDN